jgi:hypothetical protein
MTMTDESKRERDTVQTAVAQVMDLLQIQGSYTHWITSLVLGAPRGATSCCGNACMPCTLTIDRAVELARERLGLPAL